MAIDSSTITIPVAIANGQTTSSAVTIPSGLSPIGFITPAALTSTAMTFTVSVDDSTFVALKKNDGSASISYTVTTSSYYPMNPADFFGISVLKFVGGSSEGGARTLTLVCRPV